MSARYSFLILKYTFSRNVTILVDSVGWLFGMDYTPSYLWDSNIFATRNMDVFQEVNHFWHTTYFRLFWVMKSCWRRKALSEKNCRLLKSRSLGCNTAITSPSRYHLERPIISRSENLILVGSQKLCYMFYRCLFDLLIINFK